MNKDSLKTGKPDAVPVMSAHDFAQGGAQHVAYIKPVEGNGWTALAVVAAHGHRWASTDTPGPARAAAYPKHL